MKFQFFVITKSIEASEAYSYQFNLKIVGVQLLPNESHLNEQPTSVWKYLRHWESRTSLWVTLTFVHWVPSWVASNRLNTIICKFVCRLAKDNVIANRRNVNGLSPVHLGFNSNKDVSHINLYDHLTQRLQELLCKSKKFKDSIPTSIAGRRIDFSFLQKTDNYPPLKLKSLYWICILYLFLPPIPK